MVIQGKKAPPPSPLVPILGVLGVLVVLGGVGVAFFSAEERARKHAEEEERARLDAEYRKVEARRAREAEEAKKDDAAFEAARGAGLAGLQGYLEKTPSGSHASEARSLTEKFEAAELRRAQDEKERRADHEERALYDKCLEGGDAAVSAYLARYLYRPYESTPVGWKGPPPLPPRAVAAITYLYNHHRDGRPGESTARAQEALSAVLLEDPDENRKVLGALIRDARKVTPARLTGRYSRRGGSENHDKLAKPWLRDSFATLGIALDWVDNESEAALTLELEISPDPSKVFARSLTGEKAKVILRVGNWSKTWRHETPDMISYFGGSMKTEPARYDIELATASQIARGKFFPW